MMQILKNILIFLVFVAVMGLFSFITMEAFTNELETVKLQDKAYQEYLIREGRND